MSVTLVHPEDIRAELRKRHGTVNAFALARGVKPQAIADFLRGRTSKPVARIIADELGLDEVHVGVPQSMNMDDSADVAGAHRLNAEAR